jgi:septin family protein
MYKYNSRIYIQKNFKIKIMLCGTTAGKSQFINPMVCPVRHKYFWIPPNVKLPINTTLVLSLSLCKTETAFSETVS